MKKMLFIASALLLGASGAWAQGFDNGKQVPYVEITSSADTSVAPNKFRISISISEAPTKGKTTIGELERSLARALDAAGVDIKKQLVITDQSNASGKRKDIYQYKNYLLTLTDPAMVEAVFDELQANGISNASLTQSTRSDLRELQASVRIKAMKNAQNTASELAAAIGQRIGKAIYIQSYSSAPETGMVMIRGLSSKAATGNAIQEDALSNVKFNDVRVSQSVTVRFVLE
ncbi:SIMPL domain-containing protein [uncultured Rikenella sp.]|uniref:SIMPL domain-containing protein n=1 Tax=uncultured Rikenella sp. TaxID=368003 RepID=UPI00262B1C37|nr:SIMPL domain-containing protein [uncultured Rikenella sp.]